MNFSWYCFRYYLAYSKFSKLNSPLVPEKSEGKQKLLKKIGNYFNFYGIPRFAEHLVQPCLSKVQYNTKALLRTPEKLIIHQSNGK